MKRTCKTCFRFSEDEIEARDKGLESRNGGFLDYSYKPRPGIRTRCCCRAYAETISPDFSCEHHKYRWTWNLSLWWRWRAVYSIKRWRDKYIRMPIGSLRKPVKLEIVNYYAGLEPRCPHCGEMPYSFKQCQFCGQRFLEMEGEIE